MLGRQVPPAFFHHPLIMKTATQKLSKADRDTSVRDLRASGIAPLEVIGRACRLAGLTDGRLALSAGDAMAHVAERWASTVKRL
jgi:glutamyl/glutaminyl-tRNA synthetase